MLLPDILEKVTAYRTRYVTVTGGEPLAQQPCLELLKALCDADASAVPNTMCPIELLESFDQHRQNDEIVVGRKRSQQCRAR